jgi:hypothetical protein
VSVVTGLTGVPVPNIALGCRRAVQFADLESVGPGRLDEDREIADRERRRGSDRRGAADHPRGAGGHGDDGRAVAVTDGDDRVVERPPGGRRRHDEQRETANGEISQPFEHG